MNTIKSVITLTILAFSSLSHSALITFEDVTNLNTLTPDIVADGVTVSFNNLITINNTITTAGFGGNCGGYTCFNEVVPEDQINFSGNFLTAYGYGRGQYRPTDFERLIEFDQTVSNVGMYLADVDGGQGITLQALDISGNLLDELFIEGIIQNDVQTVFAGFNGLSGISSVIISGNDPIGIDNLSFSTATVPEPGSILLLGLGLVGLFATKRHL